MPFNLTSLIYLDRYRNEGTRTYSNQSLYTEAGDQYRHNADHPHFDLPRWSVPRNRMNLYLANPPAGILDRYVFGNRVAFPIHPQILEEVPDDDYIRRTVSMGQPLTPVRVSPSSSTRTLYAVAAEHPHALKVHFPFKISRYGRRMRDEVVAQAVAVSLEVEEGIRRFDRDFACMREVMGITHKNLEPGGPRGENWGFLVRDLTPFPSTGEDTELIPGFSLYGRDCFDPDRPPLLFDLMKDRDPATFLLEAVMLPVIRHWVVCYREFGFMLEPHAQNLLLEIDGNREIRRIVHRDLSLGIDMRRRRDLNLCSDHLNGYNRMETGAFASISYDKFMGHHFFDFLVACARTRYPGLKKQDFTRPCRDAFMAWFPDHARYLPRFVHYFTKQRDRFGKPLYEDTGTSPEWRP